MVLRKTTVPFAMSTASVLYPAASQNLVITQLLSLLDHNARCLKADGGSGDPMMCSIPLNVIGTWSLPELRR